MSYSHYKEEDPLLPKDNRSPEIQGSRPQSINDVSAEDDEPRERSLGSLTLVVFLLCFITALALSFFPPSVPTVPGDSRPVPKTVEERVNRILEDTPLIGSLLTHISILQLTETRWAQ